MAKGICRLCGKGGTLTKEHVPPKAAFNADTIQRRIIDSKRPEGEILWVSYEDPKGSYTTSLCQKCNNWTGGVYVPEYVEFAKMLAPHARVESVGSSVKGITSPFHPLRVVKQAITMACATSEANAKPENIANVWNPTKDASPPRFDLPLTERERFRSLLDRLRTFVLEPNRIHIPQPARLYLYLVADRVGRQSGIAAMGDRVSGNLVWLVETAFWPLGWVLVLEGSVQSEPLLDVTGWGDLEFNEEVEIKLSLPCNRVAGPYPLDFRPPEAFAAGSGFNRIETETP
jgi:hypothetical protein